MIIANIGHVKFKLASLKDAETFLQLMERVQFVDDRYVHDTDCQTVFTPAAGREAGITIVTGEVLSQAQYETLASEAKARRTAAADAAGSKVTSITTQVAA